MPADHRPVDDLSIPNDELLFVRIYPDEDALVDLGGGSWRPNSGCFRRDEGNALSADLASLSTPEETQNRDRTFHYHVVQFTAGQARSLGCRVVRCPLDDNPAHAEIYGDKQDTFKVFTGGIGKAQTRNLAKLARVRLFGTTVR